MLFPIDAMLRLFGRLTQAQVALHGLLSGYGSSSGKRPTRMMRNGRSVDPGFGFCHRLYYRCESEEDIHGDRLLAPRVKSFDISVNWSKYSKPWDVVFGYPNAGIALFFVFDIKRDLPTDRSSDQREPVKIHSFGPVHEPYDNNYSHSEIAVFKDDVRVRKSSAIGEKAKKEWRQIISDKSLVLRRPKPKNDLNVASA